MLPEVANTCLAEEMTSRLGLQEYGRFCGKRERSRQNKQHMQQEVVRREAESRGTIGLRMWDFTMLVLGEQRSSLGMGPHGCFSNNLFQEDNSDINVEKKEVAGR